jgi:hypothetical protein
MRTQILVAATLIACGSGDSGGPSPSATCNRYLACVAKAAPTTYASTLNAYGNNSACWRDSVTAAQCETACAGALRNLGAEVCGCTSDADCGGLSHCAPTHDRCVQCRNNADCALIHQICDVPRGVCTGCLTNADCAQPTPVCWQYGASAGCVECDGSHACPAGGTCNNSNGSCYSPCDQVAGCVEGQSRTTNVTMGECLQSPSCCPGASTCSGFQALRACILKYCPSATPGSAEIAQCNQDHCLAETQACHASGC